MLLVEDDDDARALVARRLEGQGASVEAVSSAREALDVLEKERIDVLLSDIEMPGTDGGPLHLSKPAPPAELITVVASLAVRPN